MVKRKVYKKKKFRGSRRKSRKLFRLNRKKVKRQTAKSFRIRKKSKRKQKGLKIKKKLINAITRLKRMRATKQRALVSNASNEFIRDVSNLIGQLRSRGDLIKPSHRRVLRKHRKLLRKLVHAKTPVHQKRHILMQKGGIIPALIPIFVSLVGAIGGVASAATHAAISRA